MITHKLRRKDKISYDVAYRLIMMMAKYSNNYLDVYHEVSLRTDEDVKAFFSWGSGTFEELVEICRNYNEPIPIVENIIGSLFVTNGTAVITSAYRNLYEAAAEALERAVKNVSFSDFQSAVISGIASAEAYINRQAEKWNQNNPNEQLVDSRARKISFDGKIDLWTENDEWSQVRQELQKLV
jgi:hypothetical protein